MYSAAGVLNGLFLTFARKAGAVYKLPFHLEFRILGLKGEGFGTGLRDLPKP